MPQEEEWSNVTAFCQGIIMVVIWKLEAEWFGSETECSQSLSSATASQPNVTCHHCPENCCLVPVVRRLMVGRTQRLFFPVTSGDIFAFQQKMPWQVILWQLHVSYIHGKGKVILFPAQGWEGGSRRRLHASNPSSCLSCLIRSHQLNGRLDKAPSFLLQNPPLHLPPRQ